MTPEWIEAQRRRYREMKAPVTNYARQGYSLMPGPQGRIERRNKRAKRMGARWGAMVHQLPTISQNERIATALLVAMIYRKDNQEWL